MMLKNRNTFSMLLQKLLSQTGLKNASLSERLQYDVSYISKWVSGRNLPSEKNIDKISWKIAKYIVDSLTKAKEETMCSEYRTTDKAELKEKIYQELVQTYYESKGKKRKEAEKEYEHSYVSQIPMRKLIQMMKISDPNEQVETEIEAVIDVFAIERESRLLLACIEKGRFLLKKEHPSIHFSIILNLNDKIGTGKSDAVYDSIFLIHMLTSFSMIDFQLYNQMFAYGKVLFAVKDQFLVTGFLQEEKQQCLAVTKSNNPTITEDLYHRIKMMHSQESRMFKKSSLYEMMKNFEYIQNMLSTEIRWLLGHMTELLMPDDLFEELLEELPQNWKDHRNDLRKAHNLSSNILKNSNIHIMIYESAFTNFIISGELDFYNHCLYLTVEQRMKMLKYFSQILHDENGEKIKLVEGGFSTDFQYITNPCMFLSSSVCYLRLENGCYKNNILVLNDKSLKDMFNQFYDEIWNHRPDVVLEGREAVCERMDQHIQSVRVLAKME